MKPLLAAGIAVLLPLVTAPWWFVRGGGGFWFGVPEWVVFCLATTVVLAVLIAAGVGRFWDRLADEADAAGGESESADDDDEGA